ncbi:MAG: FHA domain-containing protein [Acidobacteria bacterium]|nr:FHA domain-containing protein [Acidobacteriota bacterium]
MTETGLIIGQAVFLLLLYLFIAFVVRASTRALKSSELEMTPPKQPEPPAPAPMPAAPAAPTEVVGAAAVGSAAGAAGAQPGSRWGLRKAKAEPPLSEAARPEVVHAAAAAEPHLVVSRSSTLAVGTMYDVAGGATIGRSRGSRIPITDQFISTSHARVFRKGHFWFVEDLGSLNGTYVNGRRISGEQQLHLRDEIRVGETVLRWEE